MSVDDVVRHYDKHHDQFEPILGDRFPKGVLIVKVFLQSAP
jgi:hypothetical protein